MADFAYKNIAKKENIQISYIVFLYRPSKNGPKTKI